MTIQELKNIYIEICSHISKRRLKPAFDLTGKLISENNLGEYADEYRQIEETYHFMLKYTVEGIRDPERQKIYRKLIISLFDLADKVNETLLDKYSPSVIYARKRSFKGRYIDDLVKFIASLEDYYLQEEEQISKDDVSSATTDRSQHEKIQRLFYHIWFHDKLTQEETESLRSFLYSPVIDVPYKSIIVTAVMLSLQRYFDKEKFNLLFDSYELQEQEISQRALVGLLVNLDKYDLRMVFHPELTGRLSLLNEKLEFKQNLERIIIQFIRSKETERLQQRIRDEILPEMIKISPNLKNKINLDSLMEEGLTEDKNPDWQEIFKDSPGLLNKMEEFSEMQMEGADVFMGSFSMLKSFPFYNELSNWFMPFFPENPDIEDAFHGSDDVNKVLLEAIAKAPILCNSDKYSFCFSIQNLPQENREFLMQGLQAEMEQLKEVQKDDLLLDSAKSAEFVSNQFIQDLYRFYKLIPARQEIDDLFARRFDFHNKIALREIILEDPKLLRNIGEYYFARNYFNEALDIFTQLLEQEKSGELYQKVAFCYQKEGNYSQALEGYLKADLFDINKYWNFKKIAICYRNLKQPDKALEYYRQAETIEPDNLNNQLNIGHCLLELNEFEEALKVYFKVEYLAPGNKKVWRPIAWCSFLTGKAEQAEKYLFMLLEDEPNKHDYMNMGHVQWSMGNRKEALNYYQESILNKGFSADEFLDVFEEDLPHLLNHGVEEEDVPFMLDQLRYFIEN